MDYKDKMDGWDVIDGRFELGWKSHVTCNLIRVRWAVNAIKEKRISYVGIARVIWREIVCLCPLLCVV